MKKAILALGSALLILININTVANAQSVADDMSFGVRAGVTGFYPTVGTAKIHDQDYKSKFRLFVAGAGFFEYRLLDDMMSLGLDVGYSRKGFGLKAEAKSSDSNNSGNDKSNSDSNSDSDSEDNSTSNSTEKSYNLNIHVLDIAVPVSYIPMGREGGLSVFLGPKLYLPLVKKEVNIDKLKEDKVETDDVKDNVVRPFNVGLTAGFKYEIAESGFFVRGNYEFFFLDTFSGEQAAKDHKKALGIEVDKSYYTHGGHVSVGYDFAKLME